MFKIEVNVIRVNEEKLLWLILLAKGLDWVKFLCSLLHTSSLGN